MEDRIVIKGTLPIILQRISGILAINSQNTKVYQAVVEEYKEQRSNKANRLLWECISRVAKKNRKKKWDVYLDYIRDFGKFTIMEIPEGAFDRIERTVRLLEKTDDEPELRDWKMPNGKISKIPFIKVFAYPGTSTYNTKEFSEFIECIKADMIGQDIEPPTDDEIIHSIELWGIEFEKKYGKETA